MIVVIAIIRNHVHFGLRLALGVFVGLGEYHIMAGRGRSRTPAPRAARVGAPSGVASSVGARSRRGASSVGARSARGRVQMATDYAMFY